MKLPAWIIRSIRIIFAARAGTVGARLAGINLMAANIHADPAIAACCTGVAGSAGGFAHELGGVCRLDEKREIPAALPLASHSLAGEAFFRPGRSFRFMQVTGIGAKTGRECAAELHHSMISAARGMLTSRRLCIAHAQNGHWGGRWFAMGGFCPLQSVTSACVLDAAEGRSRSFCTAFR